MICEIVLWLNSRMSVSFLRFGVVSFIPWRALQVSGRLLLRNMVMVPRLFFFRVEQGAVLWEQKCKVVMFSCSVENEEAHLD